MTASSITGGATPLVWTERERGTIRCRWQIIRVGVGGALLIEGAQVWREGTLVGSAFGYVVGLVTASVVLVIAVPTLFGLVSSEVFGDASCTIDESKDGCRLDISGVRGGLVRAYVFASARTMRPIMWPTASLGSASVDVHSLPEESPSISPDATRTYPCVHVVARAAWMDVHGTFQRHPSTMYVVDLPTQPAS